MESQHICIKMYSFKVNGNDKWNRIFVGVSINLCCINCAKIMCWDKIESKHIVKNNKGRNYQLWEAQIKRQYLFFLNLLAKSWNIWKQDNFVRNVQFNHSNWKVRPNQLWIVLRVRYFACCANWFISITRSNDLSNYLNHLPKPASKWFISIQKRLK